MFGLYHKEGGLGFYISTSCWLNGSQWLWGWGNEVGMK